MLAYTVTNGRLGGDGRPARHKAGLCRLHRMVEHRGHAPFAGSRCIQLRRIPFLVGNGGSGNWPAAVKVVAEWFPAKERALASGLFNSGSAIGAVVAPPLVAWIILKSEWQSAFVMVGGARPDRLIMWAFRLPYFGECPTVSARQPVSIAEPLAHGGSASSPHPRFSATLLGTSTFFGFPQYLKSARGFDIAAIGKFAWIPFLTAGAGNLMGGACAAALLNRGISVTWARKLSVLLFRADDLGDSGGAGIQRIRVHWPDFDGNARLLWRPCEHAGDARRPVSRQHGRFHLGHSEHGRRLWRNGIQPPDRVGRGPLFLRAGIHGIRHSAADFGRHDLAPASRRGSAGRGAGRLSRFVRSNSVEALRRIT